MLWMNSTILSSFYVGNAINQTPNLGKQDSYLPTVNPNDEVQGSIAAIHNFEVFVFHERALQNQ